MSRFIVDRRLPERTYLMFYFPKAQQDFFVVRMPFFENPKISEKKKANYQKYNVIGRSSNLYTYTGSNSRQFNVEFNMTLPHILSEYPNINRDKFIGEAKYDSGEVAKAKFFTKADKTPIEQSKIYTSKFFKIEDLKDSARQVLLSDWGRQGITNSEKNYLATTYGLSQSDFNYESAVAFSQNTSETGLQTVTSIETAIAQAATASLSEAESDKLQMIDLIIYWVNIVRSSVINNANNPILGPPVVRISHGVMYQDVPCICTDYKIDFDEKAGYDIQTLLPRKLRISMNLEEFRTGDFGKFDQNNIVARDNLVGWEAIFEEDSIESLDPGYI